jgi:hypothetical protein
MYSPYFSAGFGLAVCPTRELCVSSQSKGSRCSSSDLTTRRRQSCHRSSSTVTRQPRNHLQGPSLPLVLAMDGNSKEDAAFVGLLGCSAGRTHQVARSSSRDQRRATAFGRSIRHLRLGPWPWPPFLPLSSGVVPDAARARWENDGLQHGLAVRDYQHHDFVPRSVALSRTLGRG